MSNVKLIIFDLDGTLLDTGKGILKSVAATLKEMGFQIPDEEVCKSFVGPPLKKKFLELFDTDEKTAGVFVAKFREKYGEGDIFSASRYDGMNECLTTLHGCYSLAVATNKREDLAEKLLEKFEMTSFFDAICGSDIASTMSKEQIVAKAANQLGVSHKDCLVVGDSDNDAKAAVCLGMRFIGVTYGYGFKNTGDLTQYPHVGCAESPVKIKEFLKRMKEKK